MSNNRGVPGPRLFDSTGSDRSKGETILVFVWFIIYVYTEFMYFDSAGERKIGYCIVGILGLIFMS